MDDKIRKSYKQSKNIYDDVLTQGKWWSKLYIRLFWSGVDDNAVAREVLKYIPDDFSGRLLDVPVGTAVFTCGKYEKLKNADITCLDYSEDMLEQAQDRFKKSGLDNVSTIRGDVGNLPYIIIYYGWNFVNAKMKKSVKNKIYKKRLIFYLKYSIIKTENTKGGAKCQILVASLLTFGILHFYTLTS